MAEQVQETVLTSITDNLADSFFEGAASSNNVITPEPTKESTPAEPTPTPAPNKIGGIGQPFGSVTADDLIGDLLDKPVDEIVDQVIPQKPTKEEAAPVDNSDFSFLVDDGVLAGFEDDTPVKSKKDLVDLIKGNKEYWTTEAKEAALKELSDSLPEEVKFVLDYAKKGGDDFKSVFKILSQSEEIKAYDLEKAEDQRAIVRDYYATQGWTEDEIEEEIVNLSEKPERLKNLSQKVKPKLDQLNNEAKEEKAREQAYIEQQQEKARQFYQKNIVDTLKKGQLGELKLNKEEQEDIYSALVKEKYQSIGGVTNRLGALLDKIQYVEPNYELLAKVTMYLSDPVAFEQKMKEQVTTGVTAEQVKRIKTEQEKQKIGSAHNPEKDQKRLPKLKTSFF